MYGGTKKKKAGGLKEPKPNQKGLKKLPTAVRNKMGYMQDGGKKKMQVGGVMDTKLKDVPKKAEEVGKKVVKKVKKVGSNIVNSVKNTTVGDVILGRTVNKIRKDVGKAIKKKTEMKMGGKKKMMNGGSKPDYLDFDKDGNKKESMKSALASKKKMQKGGKLAPAGSYPGGPTNPFADEMSVVKKDSTKTNIKKDIKKKPAAKKSKPAPKKMGGKKKMMNGGKKKMMGGKKMMYKSGGFLEMPVFDLDRD